LALPRYRSGRTNGLGTGRCPRCTGDAARLCWPASVNTSLANGNGGHSGFRTRRQHPLYATLRCTRRALPTLSSAFPSRLPPSRRHGTFLCVTEKTVWNRVTLQSDCTDGSDRKPLLAALALLSTVTRDGMRRHGALSAQCSQALRARELITSLAAAVLSSRGWSRWARSRAPRSSHRQGAFLAAPAFALRGSPA